MSEAPPADAPKPLARVRGEPLLEPPQDLYIPPDALEVFLEAFEGPLDLLLYLIRRQNLDILDIPIAEITRQYMRYVALMKALRLELAAEYLVMAAMLAEIKSRMLLPRPVEEDDEEDPRAELVRRLQEYERIKVVAEALGELPRVGRELWPARVAVPEGVGEAPAPRVTLQDLLAAMAAVLERAELNRHHRIQREPLSVRARMGEVLAALGTDRFTEFTRLFDPAEGRGGVVVTFLAILELLKEGLIELIQNEPFGPIHVKKSA